MAWVGPAITGAATLGGAALGGKGQNKATEAASKSNAAALAFEREREAMRKAEYDKAMQMYQSQWNAWNASRNALLDRYGVDIGTSAEMPQMAGGMPSAAPAPTAGAVTPQMPAQGATLGDIVNSKRSDLGTWNDWSRYGLS